MMMVVPEAWEKTPNCPTIKGILRIQFLYYGPWDGPTSIPFTDGDVIGALWIEMDKTSRYTVTKNSVS
jgi:glutamate synthase (ferredoxin)